MQAETSGAKKPHLGRMGSTGQGWEDSPENTRKSLLCEWGGVYEARVGLVPLQHMRHSTEVMEHITDASLLTSSFSEPGQKCHTITLLLISLLFL